MSTNYEESEKRCEEIRAENNKLLDMFEAYLKKQGLAQSTIDKHLGNMDFYLNTFLLYYEPLTMESGLTGISEFLGDWFLRKAMWSSQTSIKSNISSIKKFYAYMAELGKIDKEDYKELLSTIREEKEMWLENCRAYEAAADIAYRETKEAWNKIEELWDDTEGDF